LNPLQQVLCDRVQFVRPLKDKEEKGPEVDFMYGKAFLDLDGHAWELFFLDQSKMPATPQS
jgi:hypothetical protein